MPEVKAPVPWRQGAIRAAAVAGLCLALSAAACSKTPPAGGTVVTDRSADAAVAGGGATEVEPRQGVADEASTAARFQIPPGHLPPPGQCRVWMPGEPPGQQKKKYPVGRCSDLRLSMPADAWLVYRPAEARKEIRVWEYGPQRTVLRQRIYDATTGELLRHVGPLGS